MSIASQADDDVIRIACWNVEHNGLTGHTAGGDDRRRRVAHQVLSARRVNIVFRQELAPPTSTGGVPCTRRARLWACPR